MATKYDPIPTAAPIGSDEEYARRLQAQEEASYVHTTTYSSPTYTYGSYMPPPPPRHIEYRAPPRVVYRSAPVYDPLVEVWILCCLLFFFFAFFIFIIMLSYYYG